MNRITLTLSGFTVLLGACGDEKAPVRSEFNADVRSPFRYEFFDAETDCGTGLQTFESLTQMCIHVQDPLRNNDCATEKRERHFDDEDTRIVGPLLLRPARVGGYWHVPMDSSFLAYQCEETWACES